MQIANRMPINNDNSQCIHCKKGFFRLLLNMREFVHLFDFVL